MTEKLEARVTVIDPIEGIYRVQGPDGKEYQVFNSSHYDDSRVQLSVTNEQGKVGEITYVRSVQQGVIRKNNSGIIHEVIGYFVRTTNDEKGVYRVSRREGEDPDAEQIHPLDYLLREVATPKNDDAKRRKV